MLPTNINRYLQSTAPEPVQLWYQMYSAWRWGEREIRTLPTLCNRRLASIDVGANRGEYLPFLSLWSASVTAYEANPSCIPELRSRHGRRAQIIHEGVSSREDWLKLIIPVCDDRSGSASFQLQGLLGVETREVEVSVRPLGDALESAGVGAVGFIKIDVEGHELEVLRGAIQILERDQPNLLVESESRHRQSAPKDVFEFLQRFGYHGWFAWRNTLYEIAQFEAEIHQNISTFSTSERRTWYANNFIFSCDKRLAGKLRRSLGLVTAAAAIRI